MQVRRPATPSRLIHLWFSISAALALLITACERSAESGDTADPTPSETVEEHPIDRTTNGSAAGESQPGQTSNRLIHEKSPYLLQHAYNPVDWFPWGDEAFEKAKRENKPIFLSIGYSTCHWCHVMEHESFESQAIAAFMNEHFVSIKVDREERPDIDRVYMSFVQATTGRGGWPMSVWLTPDRKPFFGGTYFPPQRVGGRPGFLEVLRLVNERWGEDPATIAASAERMLEDLRQRSRLHERGEGDRPPLQASFIDAAYETQKGRFDSKYAGFGQAPKFPRPSELLFLHRVHVRKDDPEALRMSTETLLAMADGGIHDQLAGGFHRYSTDAFWRLPHFEKMLYDQAQLVIAFLEAYQLSGDERLARVAQDILDYVRRDLTSPEGGFFSAEDADSPNPEDPSDSLEGAFYVWKHSELATVLGPELLELAVQHYGVRPEGNLSSHELAGYNVLFIAEPLADAADSLGLSIEDAETRVAEINAKLLAVRTQRPRPHLDDKVLTSWNGLMISAFARAHQVIGRQEDRTAAVRATEFILATLWDADQQVLLRRYRDGEAKIAAFNVDYAYLIQGLLDLYETTFEYRWLDWAGRLTERQIVLFGDPEHGGFFEVTGADPSVLIRTKEEYDGAQPTSNSVTVMNLLRLAEMTDSAQYRALALQTLQLYAPTLERFGVALPAMLTALDFHLAAHKQVIIAGRPDAADTGKLLQTLHRRFLPHAIILLADGGEAQKKLAGSLPIMASIEMQAGRATAYVCQDYTCQLPVTTPDALAKQLDAGSSP